LVRSTTLVYIPRTITNLVLASGSSRSITRLGASSTFVSLCTLCHHLLEVDVRTDGILVSVLSRVDSTGIRGVSSESLKGVEVSGRARLARIPGTINFLLRFVIPFLLVVLSILEEKASAGACSERRRSKGTGRNGEGSDDKFLELS